MQLKFENLSLGQIQSFGTRYGGGKKMERRKSWTLGCCAALSVVRYPSCDTTTRNWEKEKEDKQSTAAMAAFAKAILSSLPLGLLFSPSCNRGWLAQCGLVEDSRLLPT